MMATTLSTRNKELKSKDLDVPKKVIFETYLFVIFLCFINSMLGKHGSFSES